MNKPSVCIVIPTFNSKRFLGKCLMSIRRQTYPNVNVIVVDDYSKDRTREIAEQFAAKVVLFRGLRSAARNYGASFSKSGFILSVDSDMELTRDVVRACIAKVADGFDALIIPELSIGEGYWTKCKALEKACYVGDDTIEAARFFKRSVFEKIGGYDSRLETGEDWDLNQRIGNAGYHIGRVNSFIKHNEGRLSLRETTVKKHYYGKTIRRYRKKHPKEAKRQLRLIRPAFIRNWRMLAKDPVHASGMLLMKTCEFTAGGLAALAN